MLIDLSRDILKKSLPLIKSCILIIIVKISRGESTYTYLSFKLEEYENLSLFDLGNKSGTTSDKKKIFVKIQPKPLIVLKGI